MRSVLGVFLEPERGFAKPKTVAPLVHIPHQPVFAHAGYFIGKQYLQIAHGCLFKIVATGIAVEARASLLVHADGMTCFMQQGVNRCIAAYVYVVGYDARFTVSPE